MKRVISLILAFIMVVGVLCVSSSAAETKYNAPDVSGLEISQSATGEIFFSFMMKIPESIRSAQEYYTGTSWQIEMGAEYSTDGGPWQECGIRDNPGWYDGEYATLVVDNIKTNTHVKFRVRFWGVDENGASWVSAWSNELVINEPVSTSPWAVTEIKKADEMGLIPDCLKNVAYTQNITRAEFAAVSVKLYENLSGVAIATTSINPFKDTNDEEVLRAYSLGITAGTSEDTFEPDALLTREQAATMLARVWKRFSIPGWTPKTDYLYKLDFEMPEAFVDDELISDYAKEAVYFMAANKIINGVGDGKFAPKNTTAEEDEMGYANAKREQAVVIAVRMIEYLKK